MRFVSGVLWLFFEEEQDAHANAKHQAQKLNRHAKLTAARFGMPIWPATEAGPRLMITRRSPTPQRTNLPVEQDDSDLLVLQPEPRDSCGGKDFRFTGDVGAMSLGCFMSARLSTPPDPPVAG
jgi:hypothetical protein